MTRDQAARRLERIHQRMQVRCEAIAAGAAAETDPESFWRDARRLVKLALFLDPGGAQEIERIFREFLDRVR